MGFYLEFEFVNIVGFKRFENQSSVVMDDGLRVEGEQESCFCAVLVKLE